MFNKRILSGVQPSGDLHLGNYLGAIKNFVALQNDYECLYCIVDLHAITVWQDPKKLHSNIHEVAAALVASGVDPVNPTVYSIHYFGGNFGPDILIKGEYWRLLTSNYIHIGFIHLLFNMWCLYSIGLELEKFIGSQYFIIIYLVTGISGSIASCFINYNIVGAGASGAIFGISGALLAIAYYLSRKSNNIIRFSHLSVNAISQILNTGFSHLSVITLKCQSHPERKINPESHT